MPPLLHLLSVGNTNPPDLSQLGTWSLDKLKAFLHKAVESCSDANTLRRAVWDWECAAPAGPRLDAVAHAAKIEAKADQSEEVLREKLRAAFPLPTTVDRNKEGNIASQESSVAAVATVPPVSSELLESEGSSMDQVD